MACASVIVAVPLIAFPSDEQDETASRLILYLLPVFLV